MAARGFLRKPFLCKSLDEARPASPKDPVNQFVRFLLRCGRCNRMMKDSTNSRDGVPRQGTASTPLKLLQKSFIALRFTGLSVALALPRLGTACPSLSLGPWMEDIMRMQHPPESAHSPSYVYRNVSFFLCRGMVQSSLFWS